MVRRVVLWWVASIIAVNCTLDLRFFTQRQQYLPSPQVDCYELPKHSTDRFASAYNKEWHPHKKVIRSIPTTITYPSNMLLEFNRMARRFDQILPGGEDIVKEHAKLVQDINSLRQIVFVAPFFEDNRDYDDSIFHESIETTTTTRPSATKQSHKLTKSSIPLILLGGASQRQTVRSQPVKFPKAETINLVGTSVSPFVKHPYPFVIQGISNKPLKFCMTSLPTMYTTTKRPSLWERLINSIIPR